MSILTLNLGPDQSKVITSEVAKGSAFLKASTQITLPGNGVETPVLGSVNAGLVARGERKPVQTPTISSNVITPQTIAVIIPLHKDFATDVPTITAAVRNEGVKALARAVDSLISTGFDPFGVAAPANFGHLEDAQRVTVTDRTSWFAAMGALSVSGKTADYAVLSAPLFYELVGATHTQTGLPVFNITGDAINGGTVNSIPFTVFESTDSIGYIGAFKSASQWGTVEGIQVDVSKEATITENGQLISLWERNLVGIRVEARYGFNYANLANFAKFGSTPDAVEGE